MVGEGREGGGVLAWALAAAASRGSARDPGPHQHFPSAYLPIALAQYLIFKITDDKKFIEIEHKVRVRVRVRVRELTLP